MRKFIKFLRGIKLIILNSIYYKSKILGINFHNLLKFEDENKIQFLLKDYSLILEFIKI